MLILPLLVLRIQSDMSDMYEIALSKSNFQIHLSLHFIGPMGEENATDASTLMKIRDIVSKSLRIY